MMPRIDVYLVEYVNEAEKSPEEIKDLFTVEVGENETAPVLEPMFSHISSEILPSFKGDDSWVTSQVSEYR